MPKLKPQRKTNVVHASNVDAIPEGARVLLLPQEGPQWDLMLLEEKEILFGGAKGGGKLSPLDSKVCTPMGFVEMGDLCVGDIISDPTTGGTTKVVAIYPHDSMDIWRFTFDDGACLEVGKDHLWACRVTGRHRPKRKPSKQQAFSKTVLGGNPSLESKWDDYVVGPTSEIQELFASGKQIRFPLSEPVAFTRRCNTRTITPYEVGLFLGDGHISSNTITNMDKEVIDYLKGLGYSVKPSHSRAMTITCPVGHRRNMLRQFFRMNGLLGARSWEKFIPTTLKLGHIEERLEVLQGLMDTDGTVDDRGRVYFSSTSQRLAEDVQFIVRSLGGKAKIRSKTSTYTYKGEKLNGRPSFTVRIWMCKPSVLFRIARKAKRCTDSWNGGDELTRQLTKIEYVGKKPARCISVSNPYGLYIADDFIVTHNTQGARIWALKGNPYEPQDVLVNVSYVYHPGYRCLVLRKNNTDMLDYIDKAKTMYAEAYGAVWNGDGFFEFPSGAKIVIGHMSDENSYMKYMGQEWTRIIIEEVTQIASKTLYLRIFSCCRTVFPEMKTQILLTANPEGPGFYWVKERFMHDPKTGKRVPDRTRIEEVIENPFTGKKDIITRIFLPSKVSDNKILLQNDPGYVTMLMSLPESLRQAYLEGNWDVIGGKYFPEFRPDGPMQGEPEWARHCVDAAEVWMLPWFRKWCGIDIGYNHWMVCHWFFESDDDGRIYVYRTLRVRLMGMQDFGELWAKHTLQDLSADSLKAVTIWMSHDAFHKRDASPSAEDISPVSRFLQGVEKVLGPKSVFIATQEDIPEEPDFFERLEIQKEVKVIIRKAPMHRQGSSEYVRELMSWRRPQLQADAYDHEYALRLIAEEGGGEKYLRYLQRHIVAGKDPTLPQVRIFRDRCKDLVRQISDAVYAEDRLNILKVDCNQETGEGGDDDLQAFIYGLSGWRKQSFKKTNEPIHIQIQKRVHEIHKKYGFQLDGSQLMQVRWQAEAELRKGEGKLNSVHIPRRSSKWRKPKQEKPLWDGSLNVLQ